jgi:hypothetical protein
MRRYCDDETEEQILRFGGYEKVGFGMPSVCMYPLLVPERLDGCYSYLYLKSLSITGRCSVNMNVQAQKINKGSSDEAGNKMAYYD